MVASKAQMRAYQMGLNSVVHWEPSRVGCSDYPTADLMGPHSVAL